MTSRQAKSEYARVAGPAVRAVGYALKSGHITKSACIECGDAKVQAHHHNGYEPEHALDVVWLCRPCHQRRHGRRGTKPSWERGARQYMLETRGEHRYGSEKCSSYTNWTGPRRLLLHIETIWGYLRTDEERAAAVALITRLNADAVLE